MRYTEQGERGYTWFAFNPNRQWKLCLGVSVGILGVSIGFFVWCTHVSNDMGGDSFAGLVFAVGSTIFLFLAAVAFSLRRRAHKRSIGELNATLNWHICFAVIALVMVFLHSFGNFNPRTGTYALYGMIAMVISGFVGRMLDRMMPYLIAREVDKVLTAEGGDSIDALSEKLRAIVIQKQRQQSRPSQSVQESIASPVLSTGPVSPGKQEALQRTTWDMSYISLEKMPQKKRQQTDRYRVLPTWKNPPTLLSLSAHTSTNTIEKVQTAFKREQFFRHIIRYWRVFHITLAVVTVGLTLWHIEYALSLIIPAVQKFGFGYLLPWP